MNEIQIAGATEIITGQFDTSILAGTKSPDTIDQYRMHFDAYVAYAGSFSAALEPSTLARWRQHLYETGYQRSGKQRPYSVNAINQRLASVRSVMASAAEQGYMPHAIAEQFKNIRGLTQRANRDRIKTNARVRITKEQMRSILRQPDRSTPAGKMNYALLSTLCYSGFRISEIVKLRISDIQYIENSEGVQGWCAEIVAKGAAESECREIGPAARDAIMQWVQYRATALGIDTDWIFTSFQGSGSRNASDRPISRQGAWDMVRRYTKAAGLENVKPHDFRRFVGTELARSDIRLAQKQLGHKRIDTTASHYVLDDVHVGHMASLLEE